MTPRRDPTPAGRLLALPVTLTLERTCDAVNRADQTIGGRGGVGVTVAAAWAGPGASSRVLARPTAAGSDFVLWPPDKAESHPDTLPVGSFSD